MTLGPRQLPSGSTARTESSLLLTSLSGYPIYPVLSRRYLRSLPKTNRKSNAIALIYGVRANSVSRSLDNLKTVS